MIRDMIWLAPDREVYAVSIIEEPWDEGRGTVTVLFRCDRTGWVGATEFTSFAEGEGLAAEDLPVLLKRARAAG